MSTKSYSDKYLGIDPATGDLAALPARVCSNCTAFSNGECRSYRAVLEYIFSDKLSTLPGTLRVNVSPDDTCHRWQEAP